MRCITEQGDAVPGLLVRAPHGRAVAQRPEAPAGLGPVAAIGHCVDQVLQQSGRLAHSLLQLSAVGMMVPALQVTGHLALDNDHHVEPFAAAHRVMHHMQPGAQPDSDLLAAQPRGQSALRQHGAVSQVTGDARQTVVQHLLAHAAPEPVGTNQRIALDVQQWHGLHRMQLGIGGHGRLQTQGDFASAVGITGHGAVQLEPHILPGLHGLQQQRMQVSAVKREVWRAVFLDSPLAQRQSAQFLARHGVAHQHPLRKGSYTLQCVLQAPVVQQLDHVRPQLHACTDFTEGLGALIKPHIPASARCCQRRSQPANSATRHQNLTRHM